MINFIAKTETGKTETGKTWANDQFNQTTKLINAGDVAEMIGLSNDEVAEYKTLEELNLDSAPMGVTFTEEPEF